jgi:hypothetical protein
MNQPYTQPSIVEKSVIGGLCFPGDDVLNTVEAISKRRSDAERAMILGNNYKGKVKIIFQDSDGMKQVETTIWSVTERWILLKTGMNIPLHRIHEISI